MSSSNGNQFGKGPATLAITDHTETKLTGVMSPRQIDREQNIKVAKLTVAGGLGVLMIAAICYLAKGRG